MGVRNVTVGAAMGYWSGNSGAHSTHAARKSGDRCGTVAEPLRNRCGRTASSAAALTDNKFKQGAAVHRLGRALDKHGPGAHVRLGRHHRNATHWAIPQLFELRGHPTTPHGFAMKKWQWSVTRPPSPSSARPKTPTHNKAVWGGEPCQKCRFGVASRHKFTA
jgi:hypothetical protein